MGIFGFAKGVFGKDTRLKESDEGEAKSPRCVTWFERFLDKLNSIFSPSS